MSRVLWFHPRPLLPPRGGGEVRSWGLVQLALTAGHEVLVVHPGRSDMNGPVKGLTISSLAPSRGPARLAGKAVTKSPIRCTPVTSASLDLLAPEISQFAPQVAVVSELLSWSFASKLLDGVPFVYDAHNVEIDLLKSMRGVRMPTWRKLVFRLDERRTARTERSILGRATRILAVSQEEATRLEVLSGRRDVVVAPSFAPTPSTIADPASAPQRLLFVGTLNYAPNVEAIRELVTDLMPRVWLVAPDTELIIAGRSPSSEVKHLATRVSRIHLHVDVPDLTHLYTAARAVVIPMRSGAGTNLKVVEALSFGVPTLGTNRAFQGIDVRIGEEVIAADGPAGLATAALQLLADPALAGRIGAAGRSAFQARLSGGAKSASALNGAIADAAHQ